MHYTLFAQTDRFTALNISALRSILWSDSTWKLKQELLCETTGKTSPPAYASGMR